MSVHDHDTIDPVTGTGTTGHEWDGIRELNTPLPRWWLLIFYATIVFSLGYWLVYPSWPVIRSHTEGLFGWSSRGSVTDEVAAAQAARGTLVARLAESDLSTIAADPELLSFSTALGRSVFGENCAGCHGAGGGGAKGYANLVDDDWLWGGDLEAIATTIRHGIRSDDPDARVGDMPAFGRDGVLEGEQITAVARYVRSLSGLEVPAGTDLAAGAQVFADNCAACHGEKAEGNRDLGAPKLDDAVWLYAADEKTIADGLANGRHGVMPAWGARLGEPTVKALAVYVHSFGGGE